MIEINQLSKILTGYKQSEKLPKVLYVVSTIEYEEVVRIIKEIYEINAIDFIDTSVEEDKKLISINQVKRLNRFLTSKAHSNRKLVAINRADLLTLEAANSLLKNMEELGDNSYILLFSNKDNLIPTLKSRVIFSINIAESKDRKHDKEVNIFKNNLLDNIFWIEYESQKVNIQQLLINLLKVAPNYAIKDKILYLLNMSEFNVNKKLILEYLAIYSGNSQELIVK